MLNRLLDRIHASDEEVFGIELVAKGIRYWSAFRNALPLTCFGSSPVASIDKQIPAAETPPPSFSNACCKPATLTGSKSTLATLFFDGESVLTFFFTGLPPLVGDGVSAATEVLSVLRISNSSSGKTLALSASAMLRFSNLNSLTISSSSHSFSPSDVCCFAELFVVDITGVEAAIPPTLRSDVVACMPDFLRDERGRALSNEFESFSRVEADKTSRDVPSSASLVRDKKCVPDTSCSRIFGGAESSSSKMLSTSSRSLWA